MFSIHLFGLHLLCLQVLLLLLPDGKSSSQVTHGMCPQGLTTRASLHAVCS